MSLELGDIKNNNRKRTFRENRLKSSGALDLENDIENLTLSRGATIGPSKKNVVNSGVSKPSRFSELKDEVEEDEIEDSDADANELASDG